MEINQVEMRRETMFKDAVLSEAEAKSMQIIAQANIGRDENLAKAKEACSIADHDVIAAQMARENEREYSGLAQQARRELLEFRTALVDEMFGEIEKRLAAFAQSKPYGEWLRARMLECNTNPGEGDICTLDVPGETTLYLRPADEEFAKQLQKELPGCEVKLVDDILIGGLRVRRKNFLFDKTLDAALENEKQVFYDTSGLTV